ncbi:MAG TPA: hypothetical protein VMD99_14025 [Terriglobales bacterium]|nr:hypothetical protein [Terriglobales bacterium]
MGWRFKGKTPLWFKLVAGLLVADATAHFILQWTVSSWASPVRDALHPSPLPFRDGVVYFVAPEVGWYLNAWWIAVALFLVLVVLLVVNRDRLERTL